MIRNILLSTVGALSLTGCVTTGSPTGDRAAVGAAGGAAIGQLLGKDTGSTVAGAVLGGAIGAATADRSRNAQASRSAVLPTHPCADIAARTDLHPEAKADLCDARLYPVGR